jgi:hypothetical protein
MDETSGSMRRVLCDFVGCPVNLETDCPFSNGKAIEGSSRIIIYPVLTQIEGAATDLSVLWEHHQLLASCGEL